MNRRVIVALIAVFAVGALIGVIVAIAANSTSDADPTEPAPPSEEDCEEARAVVDGANDTLGEITETASGEGVDLFAAILVEQRTITFAMDAEPECFSLAERAGAEGLLAGVRALVAAAEFGTGAGAATVPGDGGVSLVPDPEAPPTTDPGE